MDVDWHTISRQLLKWIAGVTFWLLLICMTMFPAEHIFKCNLKINDDQQQLQIQPC
jgi:hypothetical protein